MSASLLLGFHGAWTGAAGKPVRLWRALPP